MVVFPRAPGWRVGLLVAAVVGMGGYVTAFALALVFDQPFGPVCAILLVLLSGLVGLIGRQS